MQPDQVTNPDFYAILFKRLTCLTDHGHANKVLIMINAKVSRESFYNEYVERMKEIRRLSAPSLEGILSADEYSAYIKGL